MAHRKIDRVQQASTWAGASTLALDIGPPPRMRSFASVLTNGDQCWVLIEHQTLNEWEISLATYNSGAIVRTLAAGSSSSTGGLVNFSNGGLTISLIAPAGATPITDGSGNMVVPGGLDVAYVVAAGNAFVGSRAPAGNHRYVDIRSEDSERVQFGVNAVAEGPGDAGSDFFMNMSDNNGVFKGTALEIRRSNFAMIVTGPVHLYTAATTASPANLFIDLASATPNEVKRSTSSLIYKKDVEPLESERADHFVDNAQPIWYRSNSPGDRPDWSWYGFGAEDLAQLDPRLVVYAFRDEHYDLVEVAPAQGDMPAKMERRLKEGAIPVPDYVAYERITVLLLDVVKRQRAQLAALEARVAALETA